MRSFITAGAVIACAIAATAHQERTEPVDLLIHSGRILSMDDRGAVHDALAVRGGRVVAAGGPELRRRFGERRRPASTTRTFTSAATRGARST
jgi:hypothetical protein